jgi:hypothetical protein
MTASRRMFQERSQELALVASDIYAVGIRGQHTLYNLHGLPIVNLILYQIKRHFDAARSLDQPPGIGLEFRVIDALLYQIPHGFSVLPNN